jgi:hypothetical protein
VYDIWEEPDPKRAAYPWRVQLFGYIGNFASQSLAQDFILAVKDAREKAARNVVPATPTKKPLTKK